MFHLPNVMSNTIKENIAEVERIENLITEHCLCVELKFMGGTEYVVTPGDGFQKASSSNHTKRKSLCDLAIYLEKLWVHSGIDPLETRIKKVQEFRDTHNLHLD